MGKTSTSKVAATTKTASVASINPRENGTKYRIMVDGATRSYYLTDDGEVELKEANYLEVSRKFMFKLLRDAGSAVAACCDEHIIAQQAAFVAAKSEDAKLGIGERVNSDPKYAGFAFLRACFAGATISWDEVTYHPGDSLGEGDEARFVEYEYIHAENITVKFSQKFIDACEKKYSNTEVNYDFV